MIRKLSYIQSAVSGRSLIESIQLCDALSACAPETRFMWHGQYESEAQYQVMGEGSTTAYSDNLVAVSEDPDSLRDYVSESGIAVYDANGDGNDDVVLKRWPETNELGQIHHGTWQEYNSRGSEDLLLLGDGAGYFEQPWVINHDGDTISRMDDPCGEMEIVDPGSAIPVDLDGDGIQELVAHVNTGCPFTFFGHRNAPGYPNLIAAEHQMAVFGWDEASRSLRQRAVPAIDELRYSTQLQFVDLNGDRLPELATTDKQTYQNWRVLRALQYTQSPADLPQVNYAAAPFETFLLGPESAWWKRRPVSHQVIDEDGDGRQELAQNGPQLRAADLSLVRVGSRRW